MIASCIPHPWLIPLATVACYFLGLLVGYLNWSKR